MTLREKIKKEIQISMSTLIHCYDCFGKITKHDVIATRDEMMKMVDDIAGESDKYRWHDLQQDPTDLPETEQEILVCLDGRVGRITYDHTIEMVYWVNDGRFYNSRIMNRMVIAWKYVERFGDEE